MEVWNIDKSLEKFKEIVAKHYDYDKLNESDTRAKLITRILVDCLGWQESDIAREEYADGDYLDYKVSLNIPILIIEAKRSSKEFEISKTNRVRELKIGGVLSTSTYLMDAINQARNYASSKGVNYCCVTNGFQYFIFKANNSMGKDWRDHKVAIFDGFSHIVQNYQSFCDYLSKSSYENGSIYKLLGFDDCVDSGLREFKTLETLHLSYPRKKNRNGLFYHLDEIVRRVFQDLASESAEKEILEHCYVDSPRKKDKGLPYLDFEVDRLQVDKKSAGDFQRRILSLLTSSDNSRSEVIFLLGSVGVGKSTFIQRFRKVLANDYIDSLGIWIYLDFRGFSDTGDVLDSFVYEQVINIIEDDYSELGIDDWAFIKSAYHAEYNKLKKGVWKPVYDSSRDDFEVKFSGYVADLMEKDSHRHIEKILRHSSSKFNRKLFLVFDNADQLSPTTQNDIFLLAQKMSDRLCCNTLISMREESYWKNRDSGPLSAFHTVAYHVQAPRLEQVLSKRFQYAKSLVESGEYSDRLVDGVTSAELVSVLDRIQQTMLGSDSSYIDLVSAIAPRDTRRALDDVASFIVSGHTNLNAILRDLRKNVPSGLMVPFHEFLNSVVLRDHEAFIEDKSGIINLYGVSGSIDASNGNRLAVLGRILSGKNISSDLGSGYVLIENLISDMKSVGILEETTLEVLSLLNAKRLVETETTIKESFEKSHYVRATSAGEYYIENLGVSFGYLDIVVSSTPIADGEAFKSMSSIRHDMSKLNSDSVVDRLKRVKLRVKLVRVFVEYLSKQINESKFMTRSDLFSPEILNFSERLSRQFAIESQQVVENATQVFQGADS